MWTPCLEHLPAAGPSPCNLTASAPSQALVTWSPDNYLLAHFGGATVFPVSHDLSHHLPTSEFYLSLKAHLKCLLLNAFLGPLSLSFLLPGQAHPARTPTLDL